MDVRALKALLETARHEVGIRTQEAVNVEISRADGTYAALINGRNKTPRPELLHDIALAFRLTEQEWHAMYRFARTETPPFALYPKSGLEVPGMWEAAVAGIRHIAYVTDCSYNLLATSNAFDEIFAELERPTNMMRWMLLSADARTVLGDWHTAWAPYVLPQLRAVRAALPDDKTLAQIEQDVIADPEAGPLYRQGSISQVHPDGNERPLIHPVHGPGWASICAAEPLASPLARLMIIMFEPGERPHTRLPHLRASS